MRINEGEAIKMLGEIFGLAAPVAFVTVKKTFRRLAKDLHPDRETGDEGRFKALSDTWDKLKELHEFGSRLFDAEEVTDEDGKVVKFPTTTVNGTLLSELGLGLGPTTNGRECGYCDSQGYTIVTECGEAYCNRCKGEGQVTRQFPCRPCNGSGKFVQKHGRTVDCRVCHGAGRFKHPTMNMWCPDCHGRGRVRGKKVTRIYALECSHCCGTGEIEVWNPVIPKGRLAGTVATSTVASTHNTQPPGHGPKKRKKSRKIGKSGGKPVATIATAASLSTLADKFKNG